MFRSRYLLWLLPCFLLLSACRSQEDEKTVVRSHLEGRLTVRAEVDSIPDYRDFEVLVLSQTQGTDVDADTLGLATTDSTGAFSMTITAPERGIYPLLISRRGTILKVGELAVAEGDSARFRAEFPMGNRPLLIRSKENAAWMAYKNTKAQYNDALLRMLQEGAYDADVVNRSVLQASTILWSLRENYPATIGAEIASAEAVIMLEGWDDSLAVSRAREIEAANPNYVEVARAARRALARREGQAAAVALVKAFQEKATKPELKAGLQSEIVVAYADSLQRDEALAAAQALKKTYGKTAWAAWADRAIYEIETLSPGLPAPAFQLTTVDGGAVSAASLRGKAVVLEFYRPEDPAYQRQLGLRNVLQDAFGADSLAFVSISMQPDSLLNEAFRDGRAFPGHHVIAPDGAESAVARAYNVHLLPTRVLIDAQGNIVRKYVGDTLARLRDDLVELFAAPQPPA